MEIADRRTALSPDRADDVVSRRAVALPFVIDLIYAVSRRHLRDAAHAQLPRLGNFVTVLRDAAF